ncbi:uncharacterized protein [Chelonus insularis]|uniref:uncharacterized protein isoform X2 n=1 Tax=Chelonus insularis TaxID=460826 RepID=UPI00158D7673|nr:uncharacterized protein LOC118072650 isoform X2 [Chelonus insularis]
MYYLPHLDKKINYHLYLLIYGERRTTWYEEIIPKIQKFLNIVHNELKHCKCPLLLLFITSIIFSILCGFIIKILSNIRRLSNQYNLQLQEISSVESIESNEELISNSEIIPLEPANEIAKQDESQKIKNIQINEECHEFPCIKECVFENRKKMFFFTINLEDLPLNIIEKFPNINEPDCETIYQVQPLIMEIIDRAIKYINDKSEDTYNKVINKSQEIDSISAKLDNRCQIKLCQEKFCSHKIHSVSKIPLLLKSRQQRNFIKNINDS